ncbi:hypothetical protein BGX30_002365, partial [Mortierella sp. GBA39]
MVPPIDGNHSTLNARIGDLFALEIDGNNKFKVVYKRRPTRKSKRIRDDLITQLAGTNTRRMSQAYLEAIQTPHVGVVGDRLAQRIRSLILLDNGKTKVTLWTASTGQIRQYLSPTPSSMHPESGTKSQWRKFWKTKIPHRARTFWWRYKRDIIPCGTLRAHRWQQDAHCDAQGCREREADKNHHVFGCKG